MKRQNSPLDHNHGYWDVFYSENSGWKTPGNKVTVPLDLGSGNSDRNNVGHQIERTSDDAGKHSHTISSQGDSQLHENRPPFYALAFIMKL